MTSPDWPVSKLGAVCLTLVDGDWIESKDQSDHGIRLVQTGNVGSGVYLDKPSRARYISEETFIRLNCTEIFPGDVLVSRLPDPIGRSCIVPDLASRAITGVDCAILRFTESADPRFFVFYSQTSAYLQRAQVLATGSTRLRLSRSRLAEIEIPLPPLEEQKRIVAKLDEALGTVEELKSNTTQALSELDALWQAALIDSYSGLDTADSLGELAEFIMGQAPPGEMCNFSGEGTLFVKAGEFSNLYPVSGEFTTRPLRMAKRGDVLICVVGATSGKLNLGIDCAIGRSVAAIRPNQRLHQMYIYYFLSTLTTKLRTGALGAAQGVISKGVLSELKVPLPPLEEQKRIVAKLDEIKTELDRQREILKAKELETERLRSSILTAAFNGEL